VAERLAACAQVQGPILSTYRWHGEVNQATEWYVHCKTISSRVQELTDRIRSLHPYEMPEIIATAVIGGHQPYLRWVEDSIRGA